MKYLTHILLLLAAVVVAGVIILHLVRDNRRLRDNITALNEGVTLYRTRLNASAASVARMQMTIRELRRARHHDAEQIRSLGLRLRRVESYATAATVTSLTLALPITPDTATDTAPLAPHAQRDSAVRDTLHRFDYTTEWLHIAGLLRGDTLHLDYQSVDTLRQVIHRVPRRFLFFRFGTKGIRQEVWSSNPHTKLVYSEYLEISNE